MVYFMLHNDRNMPKVQLQSYEFWSSEADGTDHSLSFIFEVLEKNIHCITV